MYYSEFWINWVWYINIIYYFTVNSKCIIWPQKNISIFKLYIIRVHCIIILHIGLNWFTIIIHFFMFWTKKSGIYYFVFLVLSFFFSKDETACVLFPWQQGGRFHHSAITASIIGRYAVFVILFLIWIWYSIQFVFNK